MFFPQKGLPVFSPNMGLDMSFSQNMAWHFMRLLEMICMNAKKLKNICFIVVCW